VPIVFPRVRAATSNDALAVAEKLRPADQDEVFAASGLGPYDALRECYRRSTKCFSVVECGHAIAMFGSARLTRGSSSVWLLSTDRLIFWRIWFLRSSRVWLEELRDSERLFIARIDARNAAHVRWLEWLGFVIADRMEGYGFEERLFLEYRRVF
jgi:hypothetical protein